MRSMLQRGGLACAGLVAVAVGLAACRSSGSAGPRVPAAAPLPPGPPNPSVVAVMSSGGGNGGVSTGFYVGPDRVLTCAHGVVRRDRRGIRGLDGKRVRAGGVVASSAEHDLAVIEVPREGAPPALPLSDGLPNVGEPVRVVWQANSRTQRSDPGVVISRPAPNPPWASLFRIRAPLALGCSGAPVLDARGNVVGVVVAGDVEGGVFSAVPVHHVRPVVERAASRTQASTSEPGGPALTPHPAR
jgi:S1-C subfamily serine protease